MIATLVGGALAAGGANAINMYVDRDIDKLMHRTAKRPLVTGAIAPRNALIFAVTLEVVAFVELWAWVNLLSAVLAVSATLFYVFIYTLWLKRTSKQNIVIGGAAGAMPVLVGWAAVTDSLAWAPVVLFGVIFLWTPPHFWALAFKYKDDYEAAHVPMMPVVATFRRTAFEILAYTVAMVATTLVLAPVAHLGTLYVVSAAVLGVGVHCPGRPAVGAGHPEGVDAAVQLLDHVPDAALRHHGGRRLRPALTGPAGRLPVRLRRLPGRPAASGPSSSAWSSPPSSPWSSSSAWAPPPTSGSGSGGRGAGRVEGTQLRRCRRCVGGAPVDLYALGVRPSPPRGAQLLRLVVRLRARRRRR